MKNTSLKEVMILFNLVIIDAIDITRNGLIAGFIIGIIAPILGSVVVIRRLSFIADTLSHFSLAGVTIGVFLAQLLKLPFTSATLFAIVFSIVCTILIDKFRNFYKNYKELSMPIILSFGVALSGIFIRLAKEFNTSMILYGNIYAVSNEHLIQFIVIGIAVVGIAIFFHRPILTMCFDETFAKVSGINTRVYSMLITVMLAIVISIFIEIIGVLLVSGLLIIPVATSIPIGKSFKNTILYSILFSEFSIFAGFIISSEFDMPTGSTIVLIGVIVLVIVRIFVNVRNKLINRLNNLKDIT
jgi:zinc transport system permease protein